MTELEKMQRAKMYIEKLANGIDPINEVELPSDSVLNNVRLSRCFFYISDVLRNVIENGGDAVKTRLPRKQPFVITEEQKNEITLSNEAITISEFVEKINAVIDLNTIKKLSTTCITSWLVDKGFLFENVHPVTGKKNRKPTSEATIIGISSMTKNGTHGEYTLNLYDINAQKFIIDNLEDILQSWQEKKKE